MLFSTLPNGQLLLTGESRVQVAFHRPLFLRFDAEIFREDPAFKKMVSLCRDSTYTEFFWFPNRGTEEGYWENCWTDDGNEEDAVDINESVADEYQVTEKCHLRWMYQRGAISGMGWVSPVGTRYRAPYSAKNLVTKQHTL